MFENFKVASLSQKNAPVAIRELFYLQENACKNLMTQLNSILGIEEILVLSTCNRTEVYYCADQELSSEIVKILCIEKGIENSDAYLKYFSPILEHAAAQQHLFEVSMGLQSGVIGDLQISNQVKNAYAWSSDLKFSGPFLHRLLHTIFHANKRVQQETAFRDGAASVSYACAELAVDLTKSYVAPTALIVGMGEMGRDVARNLKGSRFSRIAVVNRTLEKAKEIATEIEAEYFPFEEMSSLLSEFDVIISSVTAPEPILTKTQFAEVGEFHNKFLIDLSVPRSISPDLEEVPGVIVYNIDEIRNKTSEVVEKRRESVPQVQQIITESLSGFNDWSQEMNISPTIQALKEALDKIRQEELARYLKKANPREADLLEKATKGMMNKILKLPVLQLKAACKRGEEETLIGVLNDLFNLEKEKSPKS